MKISYKIFVCKHSSPHAQFSNLRCVDAMGSHGHLKNLAPVGGLERWENEVLKCRSKLFTRCKGCLGLFCKDTDRRLVARQRDCRNSCCPQVPEAVLSTRMAPISRACVEAAKGTETSRVLELQRQSAADFLRETLREQELDVNVVLQSLLSKTGLTGYVEVSLHDVRVEALPAVRPVHELDPIVARVVLIRDAEGVLGLVPPKGKCLPLLDH